MEPKITQKKIESLTAAFNKVIKDHQIENHHISEFTLKPDNCDDPSGPCGPGKKLVMDTSTGQPKCVDC